MLLQLLASLASERVFIACRIEPKAGGGTNKIPVNPVSGLPSDAQDPATWMTLAEVLATGYHVGIVVHEALGIFCVDIDKALQPDGTWSQLAQDVCARFPGAYMEISASGNGLHVFGRCWPIPEHRTRRKGLTLEIYTRARFILLTGTSGMGDIQTEHTAALQKLIADYIPEAVGAKTDDWTEGPYEGWRGGGTDEQIIAMLRNRVTRSVFGGGASFSDLYDRNVEVLARAYPDPEPGREFNYSAADQALANHIAWGTGYDCERTLRLMFTSALVRDKWEREDYMRRTILIAVAGKIPASAVAVSPGLGTPQEAADYINSSPPPLTAPPAPGAPPVPAESPEQPLGKFMSGTDQEAAFKGCVYIEDVHGILMPDGQLLAQKQFDVRFGGYDYQTRVDGTKQTTSAWDAFTGSQIVRFDKAHGMTFDPTKAPRERIHREGLTLINSWQPIDIPMVEGDVSKYLQHIYTLYPYGQDAEFMLAYFAFIMQHKGKKAQWCPFLQGVEGNGKTYLSYVMEYCVGQRYTGHVRASELDSRFNASLYGKLLICIEDAQVTEAKAAVWETLKPMITNTRLEIEGKGLEKVTRDVCMNFVINSNHKDGIRKTKNDRRIAPFFAAQQSEADLIRSGLTNQYFKELYEWTRNGGFAHIAYFLQHYQIPDAMNPATLCVRAPVTTSTDQAVNAGRGSIEQEVLEAIAEGREGFRNGWLNSIKFDQLLRDSGKARYLPRNKRADLLDAIGYKPHPELPEGRCIRELSDGSRPVLYITKTGHPQERTGMHVLDIQKLYTAAQEPER